MADAELLTIHTDGAARGNPGPAAYAYTIQRDGQAPIEEADCLGQATNNQAEYAALVRALEHALEVGPNHRVVVHSDSELMVKQMKGEYRVKNEELRPLYEEARDLSKQFTGGVSFVHVRREKNKRADELCNEALDGKRRKTPRSHPKASGVASAPRESARDADATALDELDEEALACLEAFGVETPNIVWRELMRLVRKHLRLPGHS